MSLYNRHRPRRFADVVGQEAAVKVLQNSLATDRLSQALLFAGPRGTGKTSAARILAAAVNCAAPKKGEPCLECPPCASVQEGSSLLLVEIDAASHRGVEDIRELQEGLRFVPEGGAKRIYVVDEVHMLSNHAFNSLLKTLEDPPAHALFVLATTDPQKVPQTVRSRCLELAFRGHTPAGLQALVEQVAKAEGVKLGKGVAPLLADLARGSARDALVDLEKLALFAGKKASLQDAETLFGVTDREQIAAFLTALGSGEAGAAVVAADALSSRGQAPLAFLDQALAALQEVVAARAGSPRADQEWLEALGACWTDADVIAVQGAGHDLRRDLRWEEESPTLWRLLALLLLQARQQPAASAASPAPATAAPPAPPAPAPKQAPAAKPKAKAAKPKSEPKPKAAPKPATAPPKAKEAKAAPAADLPPPAAGADDPRWAKFLGALKEADLPLWIILRGRPFLRWEGDKAHLAGRPNSMFWRQVSRPQSATTITRVGKEALDAAVQVVPVAEEEADDLASRMRRHGLAGEWLGK